MKRWISSKAKKVNQLYLLLNHNKLFFELAKSDCKLIEMSMTKFKTTSMRKNEVNARQTINSQKVEEARKNTEDLSLLCLFL